MPLFLRPNELSQPDYSVTWRNDAGNERHVGRVFKTWGMTGSQEKVWMWTVEFHQRKGRAEPHQGLADELDQAKAAFRRCWDSADVP